MTNPSEAVAHRLDLIVAELEGLPHVVETCREAAALLRADHPPQAEGVLAWGCFENGVLDERLVYRDEKRAGDAAFAFTPSLTVQPLYAHPAPQQGVEAVREKVETLALARLIAFSNAVEGQTRSRRMVLACEHAKTITDRLLAALRPSPDSADRGRTDG